MKLKMTLKRLFIYTIVALLILGCSTQKNTWLRRNYHNLTAHYNVYFNGKESLKLGVQNIHNTVNDDYSLVLPVFGDTKPEAKGVADAEMDRAIEKGTKLIKKHSIRKKPKKKKDNSSEKYKKWLSQNEFNKWVDNAYLMIGKSYFFKQEYYLAQQSFAYMFREFTPGPEWFEAEIYYARTYIELGDLGTAKMVLDNYDLEGKAPSGLYGFFCATYADFFMRQEKYAEAIPFLELAAANAPKKYHRTRYYFILGQLYQLQNNYTKASEAYENVIKANPPYELAFNAKVNRASVIFQSEGFDAVLKEVKKLLRDKRNQDYQDQIYYALAKAYLAEEREQEARENLITSIEKSVDNEHQKGLSFYELSKLDYKMPEYRPAYYNLDSALLYLNNNFPDREDLSELHDDLQELVKNLDIVEREDSLQRIAKMDEVTRNAFIDQLIKEEEERQEALRKQQEAENNSFVGGNFGSSTTQASQSGNWYFYNPASVSMGKQEFEQRWGKRKLEDNWRRKNKEVVIEEQEPLGDPDFLFGEESANPGGDSLQMAGDSLASVKIEPQGKAAYLKDLPLTEEAMLASNKKIEESLLAEGLIYKDDIKNVPYAIDAFNELLRRFSMGRYTEDALMNLYLCYELQNDAVGMAQTKAKLMQQFPDGEFTAYLNDPDFFEKLEARKSALEQLYAESYNAYLTNDFDTPVMNKQKAFAKDDESELLPKFVMLSALAHAKKGEVVTFESDLRQIVKDYPDSEVTPLAQQLLSEYAKGRLPVKGATSSNLIAKRNEEFQHDRIAKLGKDAVSDIPSSYNINDKVTHSLVVIINPEADINRLRFNMADYNFSKFLLNDYEMAIKSLPDGTPIIEVAGFKNRLEAQDYFYSLRERKDVFEIENLERYDLYVINKANLEYLISSGDQVAYNQFFEKNYLSAESFKGYSSNEMQELISGSVAETENGSQPKENTEVVDEKPTAEEGGSQPDVPKNVEPPLKKEESTVQPPPKEEEVKNIIQEEKPAATIVPVETEDKVEEAETLQEEVVVSEASTEVEKFSVGQGSHNAFILFKKAGINTKRLAMVFKNYTKSNYGTKYDVSSSELADGYFYIKVAGCANASEAKAYLQKIKMNDFLMRDINKAKHYLWAVTDINLIKIQSESSMDEYQEFYLNNY